MSLVNDDPSGLAVSPYLPNGGAPVNAPAATRICTPMHEVAPGVPTVLGCNGSGVAIATMVGRDLARFLRYGRADQMMIPFSPLKRIPAYSIHRPLVRSLVSYYQLRDALNDVLRMA